MKMEDPLESELALFEEVLAEAESKISNSNAEEEDKEEDNDQNLALKKLEVLKNERKRLGNVVRKKVKIPGKKRMVRCFEDEEDE
jgi:hypothetical protein